MIALEKEDKSQLSDTAVKQSGEGPGTQPWRISRSATTEKSGKDPVTNQGDISNFLYLYFCFKVPRTLR